jgi:hypothetical protein
MMGRAAKRAANGAAALLLTALLQPLTARLRRAGLGPLAATWCTPGRAREKRQDIGHACGFA